MAFEPLLSGLTWIFVVMVPLALLIVLFDSNADPAPPQVNTRAAHLCGDSDPRSASDTQSPLPERRPRRYRPPVPLTPKPPPQATAPGIPPTSTSRRTHTINTPIDRLMARRHVEAVFDDNSDFDFHPGDEDYWSGEEEKLSFSSSSQYHRHDRDRYDDSQERSAPSLNSGFPGNILAAGERPSSAAPPPPPPHDDHYDHDQQPRKTPVSHNNTIMKKVLQQLDQESTAKGSARAAARATPQIMAAANSKAKQPRPLPWRPTTPPIKQREPHETLNPGTGSGDIADSQSSARPQNDKSNEPSLLASPDASKPAPNIPSSSIPTRSPHAKSNSSPTGRQSSINTHIDALMRQQGIQHTNWAHVDTPFERSAGEHQFQDVESHIRADGEDPGDVDPSEGSEAEVGEPYSYQGASQDRAPSPAFAPMIPNPAFTPSVSPGPQPPSHDEYGHLCSPASRSLAAASSHHSTIDAARASEIEARDIMQRGDNAPVWRRPATLREQEHDQLEAIPLPSTSAPEGENAASRDAAWTTVRPGSEQEAPRSLSASVGPVRERQQQQEPAAETACPELNREAARITSVILPYSHRSDAERDLLASSVPSASASASVPCRTDSHAHPRKQADFSRTPPSASTSQRLCAEDPVFRTGTIDAVSPSVARQVEMRAGGVLSLHEEDEFGGEQDWSDDEYRYGDIAGNDPDDDWTEMPSNR